MAVRILGLVLLSVILFPSHVDARTAISCYVLTMANHFISENIQNLQFLNLSHLTCKMTPTCQVSYEDETRMFRT